MRLPTCRAVSSAYWQTRTREEGGDEAGDTTVPSGTSSPCSGFLLPHVDEGCFDEGFVLLAHVQEDSCLSSLSFKAYAAVEYYLSSFLLWMPVTGEYLHDTRTIHQQEARTSRQVAGITYSWGEERLSGDKAVTESRFYSCVETKVRNAGPALQVLQAVGGDGSTVNFM